MRSDAADVDEYLDGLPDDRRPTLSTVRQAVLDNLPAGYEEVMQYGMISYVVPLDRFPRTYNGQPLTLASLANQKRHMALYLLGIYGDEDSRLWLRQRWKATGKKLDMGKSCLRFRSLDDLALDLVGAAIARTAVEDLIDQHERAHA